MQQMLACLYLAIHGYLNYSSSDTHTEIRIERDKDGDLSWGSNCFMPWEIYFLPDGKGWVTSEYDDNGKLREDLDEGDFEDLPMQMTKLGRKESDKLEAALLALHPEEWDSSFDDEEYPDYSWELFVELEGGEGGGRSFRSAGSNLVPRDMKKLLGILSEIESGMDEYISDIDSVEDGRVLPGNRMPEAADDDKPAEGSGGSPLDDLRDEVARLDRKWAEEHRDGVFKVHC